MDQYTKKLVLSPEGQYALEREAVAWPQQQIRAKKNHF